MRIKKLIRKLILENFNSNVKISKIEKNDIEECLNICSEVFSNVMSKSGVYNYVKHTADWNISIKASLDDKIIGCYIFNEESVTNFENCQKEDLKSYKNLRGIQGVALAVLPEFKGLGIGKKLRDFPLHLGYDYIWGQHLKGLKNIDNWTKFGRRVVADCGGLIITLMDLKSKNFDDFHSFQEQGHTCGPTCIKMVSDFLNVKYDHFDQIIDLCGCNTTTGTIDTGIKNALDNLGINNQQNKVTSDSESAMKFLDDLLEKGDIFIMRTLTRGIKHWIIVYGKKDNNYFIADPWLGKINYNEKEIIKIWEPRDFDGFVIKK